ncbi:739_t:CDS:1, partial [Funneliformis geosporum]
GKNSKRNCSLNRRQDGNNAMAVKKGNDIAAKASVNSVPR